MMIRTIPLSKLVPSPRNVRRSVDEQADQQLKADIEARGLLQNLIVSPGAKPRGSFAVEAGGRRLRALQRLAEEGKLDRSHEVSCLVIERDAAAQEASLAENFQRLSMNPADECLAFQQLIDQGADAEAIARRFGLTVRFVEGRLRLAGLAPAIFEALGAGEISLDVAKAYAATPDQERQAQVFEQMSRGWSAAHPDSIRRMMTQATISAADRRARFVGEEAYLAAGGRIERDLFSQDDDARWLDVALVERLAAEKLETVARDVASEQGLAFVRPSLDSWIGHAQTEGLRRVPLSSAPLTQEETARADALEDELEDLSGAIEDEGLEDDARQAMEARVVQIGDELAAIVNKPPVLDDALRPSIGAFMILDEQGRPKLDGSFYAPVVEPDPRSSGGEDDEEASKIAPCRSGGLSQRLVDELAMQRRDVLAAHVAADPGFALDLAIFLMVDQGSGIPRERSGSSLVALPPSDPIIGFETPGAAASLARAQEREALDVSWRGGGTRALRFDAFRALPEEARAAWLGHAVASTLEASLAVPGQRGCAFHDHLGQLLGIDVATWWRPTGLNYFDRVPKSLALAALTEIGGPALAERYAKARKVELTQACERIFSGDFIAEVEIKQAACAWVPAEMRFAGALLPVTEEDASLTASEEPHDDRAPTAEASSDLIEEAA